MTVGTSDNADAYLKAFTFGASNVPTTADRGDWDGDLATHTSTGQRVVVLTPGRGCYRCTKLFSVARREETPCER